MKYLLKTLLISLIILFSLKLIIHVFNKEHQVKYTIGNFDITESFTAGKKHNYYFDIKSDDININFQIYKNYNKSKKVLSKILEFQHKTILNADEIKRTYLQNLRIEKSSNTITTKQYYFQPKTSIQNPEEKSHTPETPAPTQTQSRTWMFKRID